MPGFNEAKYLAPVLEKLTKIHKQVVFIDDGSSDATAAVAKKHLEHTLVHTINLGKGAALKTGCEYAFNHLGAEAVIFMDSDGQHNPEEIPQFIEQFEQGAQVIFGERRIGSEMPLLRIIGNRLASFVIYVLFGAYIPDIPSGFKAFSKKAYQQVRWNSTGYEVELELAARVAKYRIPFTSVSISTIYHDMDRGMSPITAIRMIGKALAWKVSL